MRTIGMRLPLGSTLFFAVFAPLVAHAASSLEDLAAKAVKSMEDSVPEGNDTIAIWQIGDRTKSVDLERLTDKLELNPGPSGCKKLTGSHTRWRIRIGDYRILYEIDDTDRSVIIFRISHRKTAYR